MASPQRNNQNTDDCGNESREETGHRDLGVEAPRSQEDTVELSPDLSLDKVMIRYDRIFIYFFLLHGEIFLFITSSYLLHLHFRSKFYGLSHT